MTSKTAVATQKDKKARQAQQVQQNAAAAKRARAIVEGALITIQNAARKLVKDPVELLKSVLRHVTRNVEALLERVEELPSQLLSSLVKHVDTISEGL